MAKAKKQQPTGWVGWVYFAGVLLIVRALFQAFFGFLALTRQEVFVISEGQLTVLNYTTWGIIHLVVAAILLTAGFSLFSGGVWGRVVGAIAAGLGIVANLVFLPAYPIWALILLILDVVILYAILVHGKEAKA